MVGLVLSRLVKPGCSFCVIYKEVWIYPLREKSLEISIPYDIAAKIRSYDQDKVIPEPFSFELPIDEYCIKEPSDAN